MYYYKKPKATSLKVNESMEGETIEMKVRRITVNKEPITDGAPEIFTERKDGVHAAYNIRTDRWEIAVEAMDKVNKSIVAKRDNKADMKVIKNDEKGGEKDGGAEPIQGTQNQ